MTNSDCLKLVMDMYSFSHSVNKTTGKKGQTPSDNDWDDSNIYFIFLNKTTCLARGSDRGS